MTTQYGRAPTLRPARITSNRHEDHPTTFFASSAPLPRRTTPQGPRMSDLTPETLLLTISGKDRPGVTSALFRTLTRAGVEVLDIEQIVLRRRLILGILVTAPRDWKRLRDAVQATATELGMTVEVDRGTGDNKVRREGRSHVTVIGAPLRAAAMAAVAGRI